MPFIITTKRPCPEGHIEPLMQGDGGGFDGSYYHTPPCKVCDDRCELISRRAVATLDGREVYNALYETPLRDKLGASELIVMLPDSGGTIHEGDGTTITVESVGSIDLFNLAGLPKGPLYKTVEEVVAAYNEKQARS